MDAISCVLRGVAWSPFSDEFERAQMPRRFNIPQFISYDEKTDPVEHVSHYIQMMSLYNQNEHSCVKYFLLVSGLPL